MTDLKDELAPLIGHMTIEWNEVQQIVFFIFSALLGTPLGKTMGIFFAVKSDAGQRDMTLDLAREVLGKDHPDLMRQAQSVFAAINQTAGRRNDFIHTIWHFPQREGEMAGPWLEVRKRLTGKDPIAEVAALRSDIQRLHHDILDAYLAIRQVTPPPMAYRPQPSTPS